MEPFAALSPFLVSLGIGLLIGLERERARAPGAGLRTFALVALLGSAAAAVSQRAEQPWLIVATLAGVIGAALVSYLRDPQRASDPGITTVIALLVCHLLGALAWYDHSMLAVALAVATTTLLYFKPQLHDFSHRVSGTDMQALLQFAALAFMLLPLLPDHGYGPYAVINPFRMGLLVVLISGLGLTGYLLLKWLAGPQAMILVGLLGGLVSSTATTLAFARQVRARTLTPQAAAQVVQIANLTVLARLVLLVAIVDTPALPGVVAVLVPALLGGVAVTWQAWRQQEWRMLTPPTDIGNPVALRAALGFSALFTVVMLAGAWLREQTGLSGIYALAAVSGLTDVDAISLTGLQLHRGGELTGTELARIIALAYTANLLFKLGMVQVVAGRGTAWPVARGFIASLTALALALLVQA